MEKKIAGKDISEMDETKFPPCIAERANFMCPTSIKRFVSHPYTNTNDLYKDFQPTPFVLPSYSLAAVPFRWMMKNSKNGTSEVAEEFEISSYDPEVEPDLGFSTTWVQDKRNQEVLLQTFFSAIKPEKSLCFIYAKHVPLIDNVDRVLIGVGRVLKIEQPVEYKYKEPRTSKQKSVIWETIVHHSIRENFSDGFILPYQKILEKTKNDSSVDLTSFVAYAPNREEFSYASEHVSHSSAIDALLSLAGALKRAESFLGIDYSSRLKWIDDRMSEIWKMRGPYPGIGAVLTAFGIEGGTHLAWEIAQKIESGHKNPLEADPWALVDKMFKKSSDVLSKEQARKVGKTLQETWKGLSETRKDYLKLLSRIEIDNEQAKVFYDEASREEQGAQQSDSDFINNPYLFYETSRLLHSDYVIDFRTVDKGMIPDKPVIDKFPLPEPSCISELVDKRRVRALVISQLEKAGQEGHSLLPSSLAISKIKDFDIKPQCPVTGDIMTTIEPFFESEVCVDSNKSGKTYQLKRLFNIKEIISEYVNKRLSGKRHVVEADWDKLLEKN